MTVKRSPTKSPTVCSPDVHGFVYFIEAPAVRMVKIGVAVNPYSRLAELRTGSPVELVLRGAIAAEEPRAMEAHLHYQFWRERRRGEWFTLSPNIRHMMRGLQMPPRVAADDGWLQPSARRIVVGADETVEEVANRAWTLGVALGAFAYAPAA